MGGGGQKGLHCFQSLIMAPKIDDWSAIRKPVKCNGKFFNIFKKSSNKSKEIKEIKNWQKNGINS